MDEQWPVQQGQLPEPSFATLPQRTDTALMKAACQHVSVLDYRKGAGHTEELSIGDGDTAPTHETRTEDWGSCAVKPGLLQPRKIPE